MKNLRKAHLTNSEKFLKKFGESVDRFTYYEKDLQNAFDKATQVWKKLQLVQLLELVSTFDDSLLDVVIRKLAKNV